MTFQDMGELVDTRKDVGQNERGVMMLMIFDENGQGRIVDMIITMWKSCGYMTADLNFKNVCMLIILMKIHYKAVAIYYHNTIWIG